MAGVLLIREESINAPRAEVMVDREQYLKIRQHRVIVSISPRLLYDLIKARVEDIGEYGGGNFNFDTDTIEIKLLHEKYDIVEEGYAAPRKMLITDGTKMWVE